MKNKWRNFWRNNKRIKIWAIVLLCSILTVIIEERITTEKIAITAYIDKEFKSSNSLIEERLNIFQGNKKYKFKVSNKMNKNQEFIITSEFDKISSTYETIGETPMVVIMQNDKDRIKSNKVLNVKSQWLKTDETEINFKKIMEAVVNDENWSKFGLGNEPIRIFCPKLESNEGELFYQFLLITANGGTYPKQEELEACKEDVEKFLGVPNVKEIDNVKDRLIGVNTLGKDLYVTFENELLQLNTEYSKELYITYPFETIEKRIYYQSNSQIGDRMLKKIDKSSIWTGDGTSIRHCICATFGYRFSGCDIETTFNVKNHYNAVEIPEKVLLE